MERFIASIPEWEDDNRMNALFAAFPEEDVLHLDSARSSLRSKVSFWCKVLQDYFEWRLYGELNSDESSTSGKENGQTGVGLRERGQSAFMFCEHQLKYALRRKGRSPLGMNSIMKRLEFEGKIQLYDDFLTERSWGTWAINRMIKKPLLAAFESVKQQLLGEDELGGSGALMGGVAGGTGDQEEVNFLHKQLLEQTCVDVLKRHFESVVYSNTDNIVSYEELTKKLLLSPRSGLPLHLCDSDVLLVLEKLRRDGKVALSCAVPDLTARGDAIMSLKEMYIKFTCSANENTKVCRFTEIDCGILMVKKSIVKLRERIRVLNKRNNPRLKAIIKKEFMCLKNLEEIINQVNSSESNADILNAYSVGNTTLKGVMNFHDLSVERVEEIVDDLEETLEDARDIENAFIDNLPAGRNEEDEELLKELEMLCAEGDASSSQHVDIDTASKENVSGNFEKKEASSALDSNSTKGKGPLSKVDSQEDDDLLKALENLTVTSAEPEVAAPKRADKKPLAGEKKKKKEGPLPVV
eukprot:Nk52_evm17s2039 gene=Nk52_evmTU17s2039